MNGGLASYLLRNQPFHSSLIPFPTFVQVKLLRFLTSNERSINDPKCYLTLFHVAWIVFFPVMSVQQISSTSLKVISVPIVIHNYIVFFWSNWSILFNWFNVCFNFPILRGLLFFWFQFTQNMVSLDLCSSSSLSYIPFAFHLQERHLNHVYCEQTIKW